MQIVPSSPQSCPGPAMYYPVGWPRLLAMPQLSPTAPIRISANRDRILLAAITRDSILIWYAKPCVPIISHRRSAESVTAIGDNVLVVWRPDSSMLCVATTAGHLIFYNLVVLTEISSLYTQQDSDNPALKRDSDELYFKVWPHMTLKVDLHEKTIKISSNTVVTTC